MLSDLKRDTLLTARGWLVKRFWVYELQSDLDRCVRDIEEVYLRHRSADAGTLRLARRGAGGTGHGP